MKSLHYLYYLSNADWPVPGFDRRWQGPAVPKAVVLVPTRELSEQASDSVSDALMRVSWWDGRLVRSSGREQVHNEAKEFLYYSPLRSARASPVRGAMLHVSVHVIILHSMHI